jgi:PAP2 superfamily
MQSPSTSATLNASSTPHATTWVRQFVARVRTNHLMKSVGTTTFMTVFFIIYFHLMQNPRTAVTVMPVTVIDELITFQAWALIPYLTLWLYVSLPPALILPRRELIGYGWWVGVLCIVGLVCFYVWPTTVTLPIALWSKHSSFAMLAGAGTAANACPSMHVAAAIFSAVWLHFLLREISAPKLVLAVNWLWFLAITYSTLAIKQHVFIDAITGLALGLVFALASRRFRWR